MLKMVAVAGEDLLLARATGLAAVALRCPCYLLILIEAVPMVQWWDVCSSVLLPPLGGEV